MKLILWLLALFAAAVAVTLAAKKHDRARSVGDAALSNRAIT